MGHAQISAKNCPRRPEIKYLKNLIIMVIIIKLKC